MDKPGSQGRANEARAPGPRRLDLRVEAGPPVTGWRVHVPDGSVAAEIKPGDKATAEPAGPSGRGQGRSACGPAASGAASVKPGAFQRTESRFDRRVSLHLRGGSPGMGTSKHWAQAAPFPGCPWSTDGLPLAAWGRGGFLRGSGLPFRPRAPALWLAWVRNRRKDQSQTFHTRPVPPCTPTGQGALVAVLVWGDYSPFSSEIRVAPAAAALPCSPSPLSGSPAPDRFSPR